MVPSTLRPMVAMAVLVALVVRRAIRTVTAALLALPATVRPRQGRCRWCRGRQPPLTGLFDEDLGRAARGLGKDAGGVTSPWSAGGASESDDDNDHADHDRHCEGHQ